MVVLPAPFGPSRPNTSPWPIAQGEVVDRHEVAVPLRQPVGDDRRADLERRPGAADHGGAHRSPPAELDEHPGERSHRGDDHDDGDEPERS